MNSYTVNTIDCLENYTAEKKEEDTTIALDPQGKIWIVCKTCGKQRKKDQQVTGELEKYCRCL